MPMVPRVVLAPTTRVVLSSLYKKRLLGLRQTVLDLPLSHQQNNKHFSSLIQSFFLQRYEPPEILAQETNLTNTSQLCSPFTILFPPTITYISF